MARITVEDCLQFIPNRFELALAAAYRARQLAQALLQKLNPETSLPLLHCVKSRRNRLAGKCSAKSRFK